VLATSSEGLIIWPISASVNPSLFDAEDEADVLAIPFAI
jgi:hypothetical protein